MDAGLLEILVLRHITLVCQDWGLLIGLRLVSEMPDRFAGVVLSNGGLPEGDCNPRVLIWCLFRNGAPYFRSADRQRRNELV